MQKKEVQKIVEDNIDSMKAMLGLSHWDITMEYGAIPKRPSLNGLCTTDVAWVDSAKIRLSPKKLQNEEEVLDVLQHELVHCIVSSFHLGMVAAGKLVTKKEYDALLILHSRANEEVTTRLCKILNGIKPIKFRLEKKCLGCGVGAKPDNPLITLGICPDCFVGYLDLKKDIPTIKRPRGSGSGKGSAITTLPKIKPKASVRRKTHKKKA